MQTTARLPAMLSLCLLVALGACKKSEPDAEAAEESAALAVADLALPISLRTGDAPLRNPFVVEATPEAISLDEKLLLSLEQGKVSDADRNEGTLPALKAAVQNGTRDGLALRLAANLRYDTVALILNTAAEAGVRKVAFQVRKPGADHALGWIALPSFVTASKADELPEIPGAEYPDWDDFTAKWEEIMAGCQSGRSASCAMGASRAAEGGKARVELRASGRSVSIDFYRRGLTKEDKAEEEKALAAKMARHKEDFLQGRITEDEFTERTMVGDPSTQALFQFRYQEALQGPSPLAKTIAPLCGGQKCAMVLRADEPAPFVRVASMIGAAFPDGTQLPAFAIELPWTKKPKPADLKAFIEKQQEKP